MLGLNILVRKKTANIEKVIIEKLRKAVFTVESYDRIAFYLDKLNILSIAIPEDIIEKVISYNEHVQHDWQKLEC